MCPVGYHLRIWKLNHKIDINSLSFREVRWFPGQQDPSVTYPVAQAWDANPIKITPTFLLYLLHMFHVTASFQSVSIFFKSAGTKSIEKLNVGQLPAHTVHIRVQVYRQMFSNLVVSLSRIRKRRWNSWHTTYKELRMSIN